MIGLDTTAIIDIFKGEEKIKELLERERGPRAASIMNYLEIHFGIDPEDPQYEKETQYYESFFSDIYFVDLSKEACKKASSIFWDSKRKGKTISKFDCLIASSFLSQGIRKIATRNVRHFQDIEGLQVMDY